RMPRSSRSRTRGKSGVATSSSSFFFALLVSFGQAFWQTSKQRFGNFSFSAYNSDQYVHGSWIRTAQSTGENFVISGFSSSAARAEPLTARQRMPARANRAIVWVRFFIGPVHVWWHVAP